MVWATGLRSSHKTCSMASSTARCRAGGEPMAGNAAADAALRLAVLRRGKMWTEEARKSELDLPPMGHPLGALSV